MLLTLEINHLNPHQVTSVLGHNTPNNVALNPTVKYRMNYLTTLVPYPWKVAVYIASEKQSMQAIFMTMVVGMFPNIMTRHGSFIYIYMIQSFKIPLQIQLIYINYWPGFTLHSKASTQLQGLVFQT